MEAGREHEGFAVRGRGNTIEEAIKNAWEHARKREGEETTLEVLRISVHGRNPISGYIVVLAPPGP
jgi:hypothetical protein